MLYEIKCTYGEMWDDLGIGWTNTEANHICTPDTKMKLVVVGIDWEDDGLVIVEPKTIRNDEAFQLSLRFQNHLTQ